MTESAKVPAAHEDSLIAEMMINIKSDIEKLIRGEVEGQLAKERKILSESLGLASKVVGAAVALLLAIFTVFGLTTWKDIKNETAELVKKQAEDLIRKADSETGIKEILNDLLNRTVVSSALVVSSRGLETNLSLAANDWERLRAWIKKEDLPSQDFSDTLAVLNLQSRDRKKTDANRLLAELLNPPAKSPYEWIFRQPEKIESILANFKHLDLGSSAVELVASKSLSGSIRSRAATYVMEVGYRDGVERLLDIYRGMPWGEAKQRALAVCLALRPDQSEVIGEISRLIADQPRSETIDLIAEMISVLPTLEGKAHSKAGEAELRVLSRKMLLYAMENGLSFRVEYPSVTVLNSVKSINQSAFNILKLRELRVPVVQVWMTKSRAASVVGNIQLADFRRFDVYWGYIGDLARDGDIKRLQGALLQTYPIYDKDFDKAARLKIRMTAKDGALIKLVEKGGAPKSVEFKKLGRADIALEVTSAFGGSKISINWFDSENHEVSAEVAGLMGSDFGFVLE